MSDSKTHLCSTCGFRTSSESEVAAHHKDAADHKMDVVAAVAPASAPAPSKWSCGTCGWSTLSDAEAEAHMTDSKHEMQKS